MAKEYLSSFVARISLLFFSAAIAIMTARVLGPSGRGTYVLLLNILTILMIPATLGLEVANVYFAGKKKASPSVLAWNSLVVAIASGALFAGGTFVVYTIAPQILPGIEKPLLIIVLASLPIFLGRQLLGNLLLGLQKIILFNLFTVVQGVLGLILLILALLLSPSVWAAMFAYLGTALVGFVIIAGYLGKVGVLQLKPQTDSRVFRESAAYGLKGQIGNAMQFMNYRLDTFFVNFFVGAQWLGIYSIAVLLSEIVWHLPNSLAYVLFPRTAGAEDEHAITRSASKAARFTLWIAVLQALFLAAIGYWIIGLIFGGAFTPGIRALRILLPGSALFAFSLPLAAYIAGKGYVAFNSFAAFIGLIVTILGDLFFIPRFGINGAALASTISYALSALLVFLFYLRISSEKVGKVVVLAQEDWRSMRAYVAYLSSKRTT